MVLAFGADGYCLLKKARVGVVVSYEKTRIVSFDCPAPYGYTECPFRMACSLLKKYPVGSELPNRSP